MSEQETRQHPYAYNLRFATKGLESHERIAFTAADAMIHAKEFDTMHQRIATLESELAASKRECEGLREVVDDAIECARCEYPTSKNGFAPWDDCGHCIGCQCKSALAARDAMEGGGA